MRTLSEAGDVFYLLECKRALGIYLETEAELEAGPASHCGSILHICTTTTTVRSAQVLCGRASYAVGVGTVESECIHLYIVVGLTFNMAILELSCVHTHTQKKKNLTSKRKKKGTPFCPHFVTTFGGGNRQSLPYRTVDAHPLLLHQVVVLRTPRVTNSLWTP